MRAQRKHFARFIGEIVVLVGFAAVIVLAVHREAPPYWIAAVCLLGAGWLLAAAYDTGYYLVAFLRRRPRWPCPSRVVALCGSTRWMGEIIAAAQVLTVAGMVVVRPEIAMSSVDPALLNDRDPDDVKQRLDELHRDKIRLADEVVVIAPYGYYGTSTVAEMRYANGLRIPVSVFDPTLTGHAQEALSSPALTALVADRELRQAAEEARWAHVRAGRSE